MNSIIKYSGIAALVILLVMGFVNFTHKANPNGLAGSTACSGITCLEGGLRLVSDVGGDFESDVAAIFGAKLTANGAIAASSTLQVTGATRLYSTLGVDATTTLKDTTAFTNSALCINFFATSSATQLHLTASTTGVLPVGAAAIMTADFGECTN